VAWSSGSSTDRQDFLADLRTLALANGWADGGTDGRYNTGSEDEWIATGEGGGSDTIVVGARTYSRAEQDIYGLELAGMDTYDSGQTFANQPGISPGRHDGAGNAVYGSYLPLADRATAWWISATSRRLVGVVRCGGVYLSFHMGWGMAHDSALNYPDPKVIAGSCCDPGIRYSDPDVVVSGIINPIGYSTAGREGPMQLHTRAGAWSSVRNRVCLDPAGGVSSLSTTLCCAPMGRAHIGDATGADSWVSNVLEGSQFAQVSSVVIPNASAASTWPGTQRAVLRRMPDGYQKPLPCYIYELEQSHVTLDGVFWISAAAGPNDPGLAPEDTLTDPNTSKVYHVFPMGAHESNWNYLALEEK